MAPREKKAPPDTLDVKNAEKPPAAESGAHIDYA